MKFRKLRIAWSVTWALLAVLLCVLWVRSHCWASALYEPNTDFFLVAERRSSHIELPVWTLSLFACATAAIPWLSLLSYTPIFRSATALVALALGILVYVSR